MFITTPIGVQPLKIMRCPPGGPVVKNPPANTGYTGSMPGPERSYMLWDN